MDNKTLANRILTGNITSYEVELFMKSNNLTKLQLDEDYTLHWRKDAGYFWISGGKGEDSFEMGIDLFLALTTMKF